MNEVTATIEDYLGVILVMERDGDPVTGASLARHFQVSAPTVTNTFKRMIRDGWVQMDENKEVTLTARGREIAESVMRRHMLTEWLLIDSLDVPWSQTHLESHQLEHAISPEVESRMQAHKSKATICPHGNPLPGNEDSVTGWLPLTEFKAGDQGILRRVHEFGEDNAELLRFLEQKDFLPGTTFKVVEVLPFNETITVEIKEGHTVSLGSAIIEFLYAERS
jgi:DtxR family transcriptional regulator, Mn-dependent transcriptional regulator